MEIRLTKRFLAAVAKLTDGDRTAVDRALAQLLETFGRPHVHQGTSVRPLIPPIYELRATRALRVVFVHQGSSLIMDFVGDHGAVRDYLRNRR